MKTDQPRFGLVLLATLALLLLNSCVTGDGANPIAPAAPLLPRGEAIIMEGYRFGPGAPQTDIQRLLGEPEDIKTSGGREATEVWVYEEELSQEIDTVMIDFEYVVYTDPGSGNTSRWGQPTYTDVVLKKILVSELVIEAGELADWRQYVYVDRDL